MPLSRWADVIIHHQALHQQTPKHVVKPGYRSRQFPGFLNKPPDLFCLVIRGLIFSAVFFRLLCLGVLFHSRSVPGASDNP